MGISENIRELRKSLHMTQKDLAKSTGLSIGTIQGYEQGRYEPKLDALRLLMESLCCSYADIIDEPLNVDETYSNIYWLLNDDIPQEQYEKLLTLYNELNNYGRTKAIEQVEDLTQIPKYQKKDE